MDNSYNIEPDPNHETNYIDNKASLKVASDPDNISPKERATRVKKLAGAISHSLRTGGEINVRAIGNPSIMKAVKALAIASKNIEATDQLRLVYAPAYLNAQIGDKNMTGIMFCTFSQPQMEYIDFDKVKSILKVKADPSDVSPDERKINVKKLAGAITHAVEENDECVLRCFGKANIGKACKALAIARGLTASRGADLYCFNDFIVSEFDGNSMTGQAFYAFSNAK